MSVQQWLTLLKDEWFQGEHIVIVGPTGSGKTHVSPDILSIRDFVVCLALKPRDETVNRFTKPFGKDETKYKLVKRWPYDFGPKKLVYWEKPKSIDKIPEQAMRVHGSLNRMYREGYWTIYMDDAGYLSGTLGLGKAIGVLLNQGRSSGISCVVVVTRVSSLIARMPKEAFSQTRHKIIFKYDNDDELKAISQIIDIDRSQLKMLQMKLQTHGEKGYSDFLYFGKGKVIIVRVE